ncbi:hypothetical protein N8T08_004107 [Aspergillus melleus]|uniref:Uncharacterized protein n=1 Tax=Aspergillus melleus TaxID=138277 RepID=A0ACC3B516_9EURO|nr:hypothetical protein N8T08_004107 [Aspergillus melleus]
MLVRSCPNSKDASSDWIGHISVTQDEVPPLYTAEEEGKPRAPSSASEAQLAVASLSDVYNSNRQHTQGTPGQVRFQALPPDRLPGFDADPPMRIRRHHHPARFRYDTVRCDTRLHRTACRREPVDLCSYSSRSQSSRRCSSLFPTLHIPTGAFAAGTEQIGAISAATALAIRNMTAPELRRQTVSEDAYRQSLQHGPDASSHTAPSRNRQVEPLQQEFPSQLSPQSQSSPASTIPLPHSPGVMVGTSSLLIRQFVRTSPDPMAEQTLPRVQGEKSRWEELE